ncbi:MAG: cyclophilin-like fold protein [Candidatus Methanomethyliaceae archaeon]|nr:cyclophilin-like fold protein [Candidatus Methanomethyliaceae archaeon]
MDLIDKIPVKISFQSTECKVELVRILAPRTVEALVGALPFNSKAFLWKEEIYFETPVTMGPEKSRSTVQTGDVAYWPPGKAFCIFYGKSQPYSPVNVIGRVVTDLDALKKVRQGEWVKVSLL